MSRRTVAVVGAGPAGLVCAINLADAGRDVCIVEKRGADELCADAGGAYELDASTLSVLDAIGVGASIRASGTRLAGFELRNARDGVLQSLDFASAGFTVVSITRSALQRVLLDRAIASGVRLVVASRIEAIDVGAASVTLSFDGAEAIACEALIGADGMHSYVRRSVFDRRPASDVGLDAIWGRTPLAIATVDPGEARSIGYVAPASSFVAARGSGEHATELLWTLTSVAGEDGAARLPEHVRATIGAASYTASTKLYEQVVLPSFVKGRVALIGDAAHGMTPFLGLGANTAIEDGHELGRRLATTTILDPEVSRFVDGRMRGIVPRIAEARRIGRAMHARATVAHALVRTAIRCTPESFVLRGLRERHVGREVTPPA